MLCLQSSNSHTSGKYTVHRNQPYFRGSKNQMYSTYTDYKNQMYSTYTDYKNQMYSTYTEYKNQMYSTYTDYKNQMYCTYTDYIRESGTVHKLNQSLLRRFYCIQRNLHILFSSLLNISGICERKKMTYDHFLYYCFIRYIEKMICHSKIMYCN